MQRSTSTAARARSGSLARASSVSAAALLALTGCAGVGSGVADAAPPARRNILVDGAPHLPADARDVAERLAACVHFSGEFGGDGSERDREVADEMARLRCETVEADADAMRVRYARDREVLDALSAAESP